MKKSNVKGIIVGASVSAGFFVTFVTMILLSRNVGYVVENQDLNLVVERREMKPVVLSWIGDADPGGLLSGVINSYVSKLSADYTDNLTADEYYCVSDANDTSCGTDIPYTVNHELGVLVRWNTTCAYDTAWNMSLVRAYVNCSDHSLSGQICEEHKVADNASFAWVFYWYDASDAGLTMDRGGSIDPVIWNFEYYGY